MRRQNIDGVTTFNAIDVDVEARSESEVNNIEENIRKLTEEVCACVHVYLHVHVYLYLYCISNTYFM